MTRLARRAWNPILVGVLLSVVIAVVLGALVLFFVGREMSQGQRHRAKLDLQNLKQGLEMYRNAHGRYPSTKEGFHALVESRALKSIPKDPWGRPYLYRLEGNMLVISSFGADGVAGGGGDDADVSLDVGMAQ